MITTELLNEHYAQQDTLSQTIGIVIQELERNYRDDVLKNAFKEILRRKIKLLQPGQKLLVDYVDIQYDFCLKGFALYVAGGENTIKSNMNLLDAVCELCEEDQSTSEKVEIMTSQDAHKANRSTEDEDYNRIVKAFPNTYQDILGIESTELEPINPSEGKFGLHCVIGTIGAAIAKPIQDRLNLLKKKGISITHTIKINFSGPAAGITINADKDISNPKYRTEEIFNSNDEPCNSYLDVVGQYSHVLMTGICGDVCVVQAALAIKKAFPNINLSMLDKAIHYLDVSKRAGIEADYEENGIETIFIDKYRSNPEPESAATDNTSTAIKNLRSWMTIAVGAMTVFGAPIIAVLIEHLAPETTNVMGHEIDKGTLAYGVAGSLITAGLGMFAYALYSEAQTPAKPAVDNTTLKKM